MVTIFKSTLPTPDSTFTLYEGFSYTVPANNVAVIQGQSQFGSFFSSGSYSAQLTGTITSPNIQSASWAALTVPAGSTAAEYTQYIGSTYLYNPGTYNLESRAGVMINGSPSYYFRVMIQWVKTAFGPAYANTSRSTFCIFEIYSL